MNKSTKAISLVLMGSALALAGCSPRTDQDDEDNRVINGGGHGVYTSGRPIGSGFRGGTVGSGASARGGFGGTGALGVRS
jgi:hypothetical protein